MESYVEISYMVQFFTMMISCMTAGYLSLQPLSIKQMLVYSLVLPFAACSMWMEYSWFYMLTIEVLFFLLYFRCRIRTYACMLTLRFLLSFTWIVFYRGGIHNFQYFFPLRSPLSLFAIECIVLVLLYRKWNYWLGRLRYVYECRIPQISKTAWMKGYLDSGNMLASDDIAVIFIDEHYQTYFEKERIHYVIMNTMGGDAPVMCYEGMIQIRGFEMKKVLVCCRENLRLPMHCQILLNVNLWLG